MKLALNIIDFHHILNISLMSNEKELERIKFRHLSKLKNLILYFSWDMVATSAHDPEKVIFNFFSHELTSSEKQLLQKVKDSRDELGHSKLVDFGSSNLHTVHGSFKTGAEASGWSIKQLLKSCHQILKDSPARRDNFISITGCSKFPLSFCETRSVMGYSFCFIKTLEYEIKCSL